MTMKEGRFETKNIIDKQPLVINIDKFKHTEHRQKQK